jgi:hypothetical protein
MRLGFMGASTQIPGVALQATIYTVIEWPWLILPAGLLAIEILILLWMIAKSWKSKGRQMPWKSNILALLYYHNRFVTSDGTTFGEEPGQRESNTGSFTPLRTSEDLKNDAKQIKVKFLQD